MSIQWPKLEDRLYRLSSDAIRSFARQHRDEAFYGFMFDCSADYGEVGLCLNTNEYLQDRMADFRSKFPDSDPEPLRWNAGDWKYQGFNRQADELSERFESRWQTWQEKVEEEWMEECEEVDPDESKTTANFLEAVCRVLCRLEANDDFACLKRTSVFKALVADHDESQEDSWARLERVRRDFAPKLS
jgi:hypothetical protein